MEGVQYNNYGQVWYAIVPSVNRLAQQLLSLLLSSSTQVIYSNHPPTPSPNPFFFFRKANGSATRVALRMRAFSFSDSFFWNKT